MFVPSSAGAKEAFKMCVGQSNKGLGILPLHLLVFSCILVPFSRQNVLLSG